MHVLQMHSWYKARRRCKHDKQRDYRVCGILASVNYKLDHENILLERRECESAKAVSHPHSPGVKLSCMLLHTTANNDS